MLETTFTNDIVTTTQYAVDYYTQHSGFLNSLSRNVNKFVDFCNSVSDSIVTIYQDIFVDFSPFFVTMVSVSAVFTIYYFLRGSR